MPNKKKKKNQRKLKQKDAVAELPSPVPDVALEQPSARPAQPLKLPPLTARPGPDLFPGRHAGATQGSAPCEDVPTPTMQPQQPPQVEQHGVIAPVTTANGHASSSAPSTPDVTPSPNSRTHELQQDQGPGSGSHQPHLAPVQHTAQSLGARATGSPLQPPPLPPPGCLHWFSGKGNSVAPQPVAPATPERQHQPRRDTSSSSAELDSASPAALPISTAADASVPAPPGRALRSGGNGAEAGDSMAAVPTAAAVRVGTWNAENLSLNRDRPDAWARQQAKLVHMAVVIIAERLDLVALQEVTCSFNGRAAVAELVRLLNEKEAARGQPGTEWRFIDHMDETWDKAQPSEEMIAFVYKHRCGSSKRAVYSATPACLVLNRAERAKYVGKSSLLQRTPAYARFYIREDAAPSQQQPSHPGRTADPAASIASQRAYSIVLMSIHVKAQEGKHMGGTARDLQALGKLAKAIRLPNAATMRDTPLVLLGDFNQDCANRAVFERLLAKGWAHALAPGVATNVNGNYQFDNIWVQDDPDGGGADHGLIELAAAARAVPKPPSLSADDCSNHLLVCCELRLLRQTEVAVPGNRDGADGGVRPAPLEWQDPLVAVSGGSRVKGGGAGRPTGGTAAAGDGNGGQGQEGTSSASSPLFVGPSLALAYKGSVKARLAQVLLPDLAAPAQRLLDAQRSSAVAPAPAAAAQGQQEGQPGQGGTAPSEEGKAGQGGRLSASAGVRSSCLSFPCFGKRWHVCVAEEEQGVVA